MERARGEGMSGVERAAPKTRSARSTFINAARRRSRMGEPGISSHERDRPIAFRCTTLKLSPGAGKFELSTSAFRGRRRRAVVTRIERFRFLSRFATDTAKTGNRLGK